MPRQKRKLTYQELEEHAIYWVTDQIQELRKVVDTLDHDESIEDRQREYIYDGLAQQLSDLIELMSPLKHDEEHLMLWATEFVREYDISEKHSLDS